MKIPISYHQDSLLPNGSNITAIIAEGRFLFVGAQGPYNSESGRFERGSIQSQIERTLNNIQSLVMKAGGRMSDVVSCRIFLTSLEDESLSEIRMAYEKFFGVLSPSPTTIGCQLVDKDVEIDCIVLLTDDEGPANPDIAEALRFCEEHFDKPLSVSELASQVFLSPAHFSELFWREVGMRPAAYIRQVRLEKARILLRDTEMPVSQIALRCGFTHAGHFSRAFRNLYERAPSQYRSMRQKDVDAKRNFRRHNNRGGK